MKTVLIVYDKAVGRTWDHGKMLACINMGMLNGSMARTRAIEEAAKYGIPKLGVCWTPKCQGGVRFYIAVAD